MADLPTSSTRTIRIVPKHKGSNRNQNSKIERKRTELEENKQENFGSSKQLEIEA